MLFLLYVFLDSLKIVFTILIMISCIGCTSIVFEEIILQGCKPKEHSFLRKEFALPCFGNTSITSMIGTLIGVGISVSWFITKNWVLNNILALCLAYTFLKTVRLTTLVPGMVLLGLLFFYDIFWVFISPAFTGG